MDSGLCDPNSILTYVLSFVSPCIMTCLQLMHKLSHPHYVFRIVSQSNGGRYIEEEFGRSVVEDSQRVFCKQNQLGAQIFLICLLFFSTCFEQLCAHHQEKISYLCDTWYLSLYIDDCLLCRTEWNSFRPAYQTVIYIHWQIPGVAQVRYFLLMMGTQLLETCREKQ